MDAETRERVVAGVVAPVIPGVPALLIAREWPVWSWPLGLVAGITLWLVVGLGYVFVNWRREADQW